MKPVRNALIFGLGASGRAMASAAAAAGWQLRAVDEQAIDPGSLPRNIDVTTGTIGADLLRDADVVLTSPGVPPTQPLLAAATAAGIPVWSEPELAAVLNEGRTSLIGVTGTNGKTTTTEMIASCLGIPAAGNIGPPLVTALTTEPVPRLLVAELSSFQLHFCHTLRPAVAVLINLADDHLAWHGGMAGYMADKARIWARQDADDVVVVDRSDPGTRTALDTHPPAGRVIDVAVAEDLLDGVTLKAAGPHNRANALLAAHAAVAAGGDPDTVRAALADFRPGGHRLELVRERDGVAWVNDSKATNPHAAAAALSSFSDVIWIAGGLNKGLAFDSLATLLPGRVHLVLTIGACAPEIAALARTAGVTVADVGVLREAVAQAAAAATPGTTVLLAPAAASMDQFTNYAERGEQFRQLVEAL